MKAFEFSLQTVLDVRRIREDQARAELAAAHHRERQEEQRLAELRRQRLELHRRIAEAPVSLSGAEVLAIATTGQGLDLAIGDSRVQKEQFSREREMKAEEAQMAISRRKMVEVLRERAWHRYQYEAATVAERQVDEMCSRRAGTPR